MPARSKSPKHLIRIGIVFRQRNSDEYQRLAPALALFRSQPDQSSNLPPAGSSGISGKKHYREVGVTPSTSQSTKGCDTSNDNVLRGEIMSPTLVISPNAATSQVELQLIDPCGFNGVSSRRSGIWPWHPCRPVTSFSMSRSNATKTAALLRAPVGLKNRWQSSHSSEQPSVLRSAFARRRAQPILQNAQRRMSWVIRGSICAGPRNAIDGYLKPSCKSGSSIQALIKSGRY